MEKEEYDIMFRLEESHWWYIGMRRIVNEVLNEFLPQRSGLRILDAGCGTGGMINFLTRYGNVVGIDTSSDAISLCCKRDVRHLAQASVTNLPFEDSSFDLIVSFDVLYHQDVLDDRQALNEFRRVLKPNGHLFLRLPAFDWLRGSHDQRVHTRRRYGASEIKRKLEASGFDVDKVTYANTILFPIALAVRASENIFRWQSRLDVELAPRLLNDLLAGVLGMEGKLVRRASLPWGLSVLAWARRPEAGLPTRRR